MTTVLAVLVPLVDKAPDPADVKPGWLGLGVVVALMVAVAFLYFSMRKQLRKVDFEVPDDEPAKRPGSTPDPGTPGTPGAGTPHTT